ncbi:hypothetical protein CDAR_254961 [Caerostris darwini]|uniref:Uncharacterized protein n=1 Tax=Caerostris darwini TaxID=1538125 RepID=A0AAV4VBA8_9ARAC|nr:hypothetical protein CDAR_254961 [Caerostris darwini]
MEASLPSSTHCRPEFFHGINGMHILRPFVQLLADRKVLSFERNKMLGHATHWNITDLERHFTETSASNHSKLVVETADSSNVICRLYRKT